MKSLQIQKSNSANLRQFCPCQNGDLFIDTEMTDCIEKISRHMCYNLHKYRYDLLSLQLK